MDFVKNIWTDVFQNNDKKFRAWIKNWIDDLEWVELECRHSNITSDAYGRCGFFQNFGTNDGNKGMRIRQSTVANNARKFMGLELVSSSNSTKLDVAQLLIFLTYKKDSVKDILEFYKEKGNINHACGCGNLSGKSCCKYEHLYIGDQKQNNLDASFHELVKNIDNKEDYDKFIKIAQKYNKKFYAFYFMPYFGRYNYILAPFLPALD